MTVSAIDHGAAAAVDGMDNTPGGLADVVAMLAGDGAQTGVRAVSVFRGAHVKGQFPCAVFGASFTCRALVRIGTRDEFWFDLVCGTKMRQKPKV